MAISLNYAPRASWHHNVPWRIVVAITLAITGTVTALAAQPLQNHTTNNLWYAWDWNRYLKLFWMTWSAVAMSLIAYVCALGSIVRRRTGWLTMLACVTSLIYTLSATPF